ncbi:hypothetical protein JNB11_08945 [Kocuria palustris]|nr:hypothetical protein [Kocuria palustris]
MGAFVTTKNGISLLVNGATDDAEATVSHPPAGGVVGAHGKRRGAGAQIVLRAHHTSDGPRCSTLPKRVIGQTSGVLCFWWSSTQYPIQHKPSFFCVERLTG